MKTSTKPSILSKSISSLLLVGSLASWSSGSTARAAVIAWDGGPGGTGTDIGVAVNWAGDVLPSVTVPDTMQWNGTVAGALALVYSDASYVGVAGNTGVNLDITAAQTGTLNLDTGANTNALRLNNISIAAGAGAFSLGNSAGAFNLTLGGVPGQFHTWTNNSSTAAVVASEVAFGLGGGGQHTLVLGGSGGWTFNDIIGQGTGILSLVKTDSGTLTLTGANTFSGGIVISGGTVVATTSGAALGVGNTNNGQVVVSGGTNLNLGTSTLSTSGLTFGNTIAGAGTINAVNLGTGTNTTVLSGRLSGFTGTLNLGGTGTGKLQFGTASGNQISAAATINVLSGATLYIANAFTYGSSLFLNGGTTGETIGQLRIESGAIWSGSITLNANTTIGTNTTVGTVSGNIGGGAFTLTKQGTQTTMFTGANTYTGTTTVTAGTLQLGNGGTTGTLSTSSAIVVTGATFAIDRSNAVAQGTDFSGAAITGTGGFTQTGFGTTTLSAANTYTGATTVNRGTLKLDFTAAGAPATNIINNTANSSALTLAHGTLNLTGLANTTNSQQFNGLTLNAGASVIQINANATANPLLLTLLGITHNIGGTVDFTLPTGVQSATNGATTTTLNTNSILGGYATVGGTDWAANATNTSGGNIVGFSTVGTYTLSSAAGTTATNYLNFNIDVDSSQAPAAAITPNSLRFSTAAANTLTLTGTNIVTSGGILVNSSVGNNLSTITGGTIEGANTSDLVIFQNNTSNALVISSTIANNTGVTGVTKSGNGVLTLSGSNTYTGNTTLNAGTLNINTSSAIGNTNVGGLVINGGTLDNSSAGAITTVAAKALSLNGDFTFTGTQGLNFNGGIATVGGPFGTRTVTVNGTGTLSFDRIVAQAGYNFTKAGTGTLYLTTQTNNATSFLGILNMAGGKLQVAADTTVGALSGSGTIENGGPAGKWFFAGQSGFDSTFSGTIQDGPTAGVRLGLVKQGGGTLTLSGTNTPGDAFRIENGTVNLTGTVRVGVAGQGVGQTNIGTVANQTAILNINGGTLNELDTASPSLIIGNAANARGFLEMTSGTITTVNQFNIGNGNGAFGTNPYGAFSMSGGSLTSGSWIVVGANNDRAVLNQSGGTITVSANRMTIGAGGNGAFGLVNFSGGTFTDNAGIFLGENGAGVLNLSGTATMNLGTGGTMQFAGNATSLGSTFNLLGGTLNANSITKGASTAGGVYLFNFNGGTVRPTVTNANFFGTAAGVVALANTTAYIYSGGGTVDTNGFDITIAQPLLAPTGNGVNGIASFTGGSGYIDTPLVTVYGDGVGATAVANVSGGVVTGITITNPGVGYTATPTFSVFGGGATVSATITGTAPTANTGGGLIKAGAGTLTLVAANTYSGATTVSGGTLLLSGAGSVNGSSGINVNGSGAKLIQTSSTNVTAPVTLTNGTIDGTTTLNSVTVVSSATNVVTHGNGGTGTFTINNLNFNDAATVNLNITSQSPVILTTNLNTGVINGPGQVTINATAASWGIGEYDLISYTALGGVGFSEFLKGTITGLSGRQSATLINPAGFIALNITGDNPVWTGLVSGSWTTNAIPPNGNGDTNWKLISAGTPTDFLTNDVVLFDDSALGTTTVDVSTANVSPLATLFSNNATPYTLMSSGGFGIATGAVTINGGGMVTISNANTYAGGTNLVSGTLNINNASAIGTGALTISAGTTIDNTSGSAKTLTTNNVQNWNGDFTFGGSNDLNLGTGAVTMSANRILTTNGTAKLTVGGAIGGAAGLNFTKAGNGTLALGGANTYTGTTNVNAGTLILTGSINAANTANVGLVSVGTSAADAVMIINGGTLNATKAAAPSVSVGTSTVGTGVLIVNAGSNVPMGSELWLGNQAGSYGVMTMNGGTVSMPSWLAVARSGSAALNVNGGTLNVTGVNATLASFAGAYGVATLTGGSTNITSTVAGNGIFIVAEAGTGVLTVSGTAALNVAGGTGVQIGRNGGSGIANLDGGTITTTSVQRGTGTGTFNFNGGTLKPNVANAAFMTGLTNAYVYSGGAIIDTGTFATTIAQPLNVPTGSGVTTGGLTITGSGYIAAPLVQITGGGGTGATAVATIDNSGNLTGITITNPGVNYFSDPTFTLIGGGASNTGSVTGSATLVSNVGGGLTKLGNGTLTLTGGSTYSGATLVSAGTLLLSGSGGINGSSGITINGAGAKLIQTSALDVSAPVTVTNGTLDGTTHLYTVEVGSGTGGVIANGNGTTGALAIDSLTFDGGATMNLNTASTSAVIVTTTLTTGTVNAAAGIVTINASNTSWTNGQEYDLISYTDPSIAGPGGFASFIKGTITGLTSRQSATLTNPAGFVALSIAGDIPVWTGGFNGNWTTTAITPPKNWKLQTGGTPTDFLTTDTVLFDDSATGTTTVVISDANVNPTTTTFNNSVKVYSVSSAGGFGIASGSLSKTGTGGVTISTDNTYTGGTTVANGTLNMTGNNNFGAGAVTVNGGSANFSGNNTYSGGTFVTNGALVMSGNNTFGAGVVTISGGSATLSGVNTYTGLTTVNNGTLNINNSAAIGTAALIINGGAIGNTSGGDIILSAAKAMNWNGDFSYAGPNILDFNQGAVTIGGAAGMRTVTITAGTLGTGIITAPAGYGLTKAGNGILAMTNTANTTSIAGELNIAAGKIQMSGDFFIGGLAGAGTIENGGAASKWIYDNNAADEVFSGVIQDNPNIAGVRLGFVKRGLGKQTLSGGPNTYTDRLAVEAGDLVLTGTNTTGNGNGANQIATIGDVASTNAILEINGGTLNANKTGSPSLAIAAVASGSGTVKMTSGAINTISEYHIGNGSGAVGTEPYAATSVSGGTLTSGSWLVVGLNNDRAVLNQSGGSIVVSANRLTIGAGGAAAVGVANLSGGTFTDNGGIFVGENGTGTLNVSGTAAMNLGATGTVVLGTTSGFTTSLAATVNLLGGTVSTFAVAKGTASAGVVNLVNFNGGTLKATANNTAFFASLANTTAYVYNGGGTIDDGGFTVTVAQPFVAPTGNGVSATGLTVSGGGYIDTPLVQITGDGTGASAVANIDSGGNLTGITITNPGVNYTTAPTFTLVGGGIGNSGFISGTATLVADTGGTLTKAGTGQTTFTGAIGNGDLTFNASKGETVFTTNQTLAALNIGDGAVLTFGSGPEAATAADLASTFGVTGGTEEFASSTASAPTSAVVPEPGSIGLLLLGALGALARRPNRHSRRVEK